MPEESISQTSPSEKVHCNDSEGLKYLPVVMPTFHAIMKPTYLKSEERFDELIINT